MRPKLPLVAGILWCPSRQPLSLCCGQFRVSADSCCSDGATSSMGHVFLSPGPDSSPVGGSWFGPFKSVAWNLGELMLLEVTLNYCCPGVTVTFGVCICETGPASGCHLVQATGYLRGYAGTVSTTRGQPSPLAACT